MNIEKIQIAFQLESMNKDDVLSFIDKETNNEILDIIYEMFENDIDILDRLSRNNYN